MADETEPKEREAILLGQDEQGRMRYVAETDGGIVTGKLSPMREGELPRMGEGLMSVRLDRERGLPHVKIRQLAEGGRPAMVPHEGPIRVSTLAYNEGWERIWGPKRAPTELN